MAFRPRKLVIWLISLAVVLVIYLLYSRITTTPIDIDTTPEFVDAVTDSNVGRFDGKIGRIGDVGVAKLKSPKFLHRNKNKEVDRVFGFEELLNEEKDEWEMEKPYMNIFQPGFKCYITADKGNVQIETAVGRPTPKDAKFTGNVVIHILPQDPNGIKESFVYLDDVVFLSEKTQFSTAGPVKFTSQDAQMLGIGAEIVYDDRLGRLEFLRIVHLESLHLKSSEATSFFQTTPASGRSAKAPQSSPAERDTDKPIGAGKSIAKQQPEPVATEAPQKAKVIPPTGQGVVEQTPGEYYRCVFSKNVVIDTPDQLIFADEELCISNILWSKASNGQSGKADTGATDNAKAQNVTVSKKSEPNEWGPKRPPALRQPDKEPLGTRLDEQFVDIVVTCDNGIVVTPMDSPRPQSDSNKPRAPAAAPNSKNPKKLQDTTGRTIFIAPRIDHNASTGNTLASGPSELTFYTTSNLTTAEANETPVPVKITAQKQTQFLSASNQVIFEGDCLCTMPRDVSTPQQNYTLMAPKLTVDLPSDKSERPSTLPDIVAAGPTELTFYVDVNDKEAGKSAVPAKVTAQKQARFLSASNQIVFEGDCLCVIPQVLSTPQRNYILSSPKLTVDLPKDKSKQPSVFPDILAAGPAELTFYVDDFTSTETNKAPVPASVIAQKQARFLSESNQAVFEGNCLCTVLHEDPNTQQKYILSAQKLTIDLPADTNDRSHASVTGIEHLTAAGGIVRLATVKTAKDELLGGIELKCRKFDYDAVQKLFLATGPLAAGPALIQVDNSKISQAKQATGRFSLRRPCYAFLRRFDTLKYLLKENRIIADAGPQETLRIDYIPVIEGKYGKQVTAHARHLEALLYQTTDGRTELSTLTASGGITYEDEDKDNQFVGSNLFYDYKKSVMKLWGDEFQPCYLNGALVDGIEYNLKTGKAKAKVVAPGALQMR